jgi:SHS2 domain-containing protein
METGYRLLDHTADVGVEAWGPTPADAFAEAARGVFAVVLDADPGALVGGGPATFEVDIEAHGWPGLLVNWLSEFLFLLDTESFVPHTFRFRRCEPTICSATVDGVRISDPAQASGTAVKAVTYHQLRVDVGPHRTEAHVILDI